MTDTMKPMATVQPADTAQPSPLLTPEEITLRLRVSRSTLYDWLAKGDLPNFQMGRIIRVREIDLADFLERRRRVTPPARHLYGCH